MKKTLALGGGLVGLLLLVGFIIHELWLPFFTIRRLNAAYKLVERGMTVEDVARIMNHPSRTREKDLRGFWDEQLLEANESERLKKAVSFRVETFYLPIIYEFTFDQEDKLVGRHKYD